MFWGLIMEPQRRYTQKVKKAFHISMASLDISTSSEEPAQVMCGIEGRNYLLCTLRKPDVMQCPLDLNFNVGSDLSFAANGKCHVHLTGYLIEDYPELAEEEEVEQSDEDVEEQEETVKKNKRSKKNIGTGPPSKKSKISKNADNDEENSDDSDTNIQDLLQKSFDEDENDDSYLEEEEDSDNDEEAEEEEDDDTQEEEDDAQEEEEDSSMSDSEEEPTLTEKSAKQNSKVNGISPKSKKEKKKIEKNTPVKEAKTPNKDSKSNEKDSKTPNKDLKGSKIVNKEAQSPKKKVLQGGIVIEEIKEGQGPVAKAGKFITVFYEGRLKQNNKLFDSATKGSGFSFRLGSGEVIKGWDVGVAGMKIGGKRRITCPPPMAYGAKGSPPAIPANSTLVFEVELKKVK